MLNHNTYCLPRLKRVSIANHPRLVIFIGVLVCLSAFQAQDQTMQNANVEPFKQSVELNFRNITVAALADSVENLTLTGTTAINGTANALNNTLIGNSAVNTLNGGAGDDVLIGGIGNDLLTGGTGTDTFVSSSGFGRDVVTDFAAGTGVVDVLELALGTAFDSFAEVIAASAQSGANTVITIDTNTSITLQNIQNTTLVSDDFRFA